MNNGNVHIVISDSGWILEKLASEISKRFSYVSYSSNVQHNADIQYYITYGCRKERVSPIELALFTHREHDIIASDRFDKSAADVDVAISMSRKTNEIIKDLGISNSVCIFPGVDIDSFKPLVRIGVVGRTYHTGRKGEALVRAVMDVPGIEWHFTGEGWPGPAQKLDEDKLPAFYRSMDYILVPAVNEGGPMSVLESLASGTPVIASDVGWVKDFPHIAFERGNAESLRSVLTELVGRKIELADSVGHMTWDNWATQHDALFRRLLATLPKNRTREHASSTLPRLGRIALLTHGAEDTTLGGPSVRVPRTQQEIQKIGVDAIYCHNLNEQALSSDIVHLFNIWTPLECVRIARKVKAAGKTLIFSPIILDLSEAPLWQVDLLHVFRNAADAQDASKTMQLAHRLAKRIGNVRSEPEPGYIDALAEVAELADGLIFLSQNEQQLFEKLTETSSHQSFLVHNPVDAEHFTEADPSLFREAYGLDDYVLCLARVEHRKNQLMLAAALAGTGIQLVLAGHNVDDEYLALINKFGDDNVLHVPRLEPGSDMLRSALAGARVFALPSWSEGAPLAALEAAAAGAPLVLSDRSGEREYFGDFARYCDPADAESIRSAILESWNDRPDVDRIEAQKAYVSQNYSWQKYVHGTIEVYQRVSARFATSVRDSKETVPVVVDSRQAGGLVFDITTWVNNALTLSGIVRVECALAGQLVQRHNLDVKFVCYHSPSASFVEVPRDIVAHNLVTSYLTTVRKEQVTPTFQNNEAQQYTDIVSVGSSWMQNSEYVSDLGEFAQRHDLRLSVLMHDMTPYLFPHWYPVGYAQVWNENCRALVSRCARMIVYSQSTLDDLTDFSKEFGVAMPPSARIKLADDIGDLGGERSDNGIAATDKFSRLPFILAVGGIHIRKNYGLLIDVWAILRDNMGEATPHLVIVGGVAWNGNELARAIAEDSRIKDRIHILTSIDDASLAELYESCLFTVYPSLYEGWGLPVGESLAHGKICLASNASSMKEIAPDYTDLLDPLDRTAWAARIQHYTSSETARSYREQQIVAGYVPLSWQDTADGVLSLLDMPCPPRSAEPYTLGSMVLVTAKSTGSRYLGGGWTAPEGWGCWSRSMSPSINLALTRPVKSDLVFSILAKVMKHTNDERNYTIKVNGKVVGKWNFGPKKSDIHGSDIYVTRLRIPHELLGNDRQIRVVLEADRLCSVRDITPTSLDARELGIGLVAFWVEEASLSKDAPNLLRTIPSVREALNCPPSTDLGALLSNNPYRPSPSLDNWMSPTTYVQIGAVEGDAVITDQGIIRLGLGLARLTLDNPLKIELALVHASGSAKTVQAALFANGVFLETIDVPANGMIHTVAIGKNILGLSDPLHLDIVVKPLGGRRSAVKIKAMCLNQDRPYPDYLIFDPSQDIRNHSRKMAGIALSRRVGSDWIFQGEGEIWSSAYNTQLAVDPESYSSFEMDVSRLLSGKDGDSLTVSFGDEQHIIDFPVGQRGLLSPPCLVSGPVVKDADGLMRFTFTTKQMDGATERVEGDWRAICVTGLKFLKLEPLHPGQSTGQAGDGTTHILWFKGWNERAELDGARWGIAHRMEMKVMLAPGVSSLRIHMDCIAPEGEYQELSVAIDGVRVGTAHLPCLDVQSHIFQFAAADDVAIRTITIEVPRLMSPLDLGLNEDPREFSLRIWDIDVPYDPGELIEEAISAERR
ncbi:glycosyltransferase [Sphingobium yanoikuyae]|uniref:glycosyltransferase n=1 Tax=Sphingobium yanoikuyae TaxID=13690 RepID=UPI003F02AF76